MERERTCGVDRCSPWMLGIVFYQWNKDMAVEMDSSAHTMWIWFCRNLGAVPRRGWLRVFWSSQIELGQDTRSPLPTFMNLNHKLFFLHCLEILSSNLILGYASVSRENRRFLNFACALDHFWKTSEFNTIIFNPSSHFWVIKQTDERPWSTEIDHIWVKRQCMQSGTNNRA